MSVFILAPISLFFLLDILILSCKKNKQTNNKKLEMDSNDIILSFPGKQKVDPTTKKKMLS
jgi:hypothetical protein